MISEKCRECTVCGWCEYDPGTDTVYPGDEEMCLIAEEMKNEQK